MKALLPIAILATTVGCTQSNFSAFKKQEALQTSPLFGGTTETTQGKETNEEGGDFGNGVAVNSYGADVLNLCSTGRSKKNGSNVISSEELKVSLIDLDTEKEVCSETENVRATLINLKRLPIKICDGLTKKEYQVKLTDTNIESSDLLYDQNFMNKQIRLVREDDETFSLRHRSGQLISELDFSSTALASAPISKNLFVLYDEFRRLRPSINNNMNFDNPIPQEGEEDDCDKEASPLIIDTTGGQEPPKLTSLTAGVQFDILGKSSYPVAHAKKQISWITNPRHKFLVLPTIHGEVKGIDQMFGDNTIGPDGKLSKNGFAALAKYDNGNGVIRDKEDPIFSKLRLWSDKNRDGQSSSNELETLSEAGIVSIDLKYDPNYQKTDRYGNKIKFKSIVTYKSGKVHVIYDIWFRYY